MAPGSQQTQALLQVFANCIQGIQTSGPLRVAGGQSRYPPRAGVLTSAPGLGSPVTPPAPTGDPIQDYGNGYGDPGGGYPPGTWNVYFGGDQITYGGPTSITYGGDTQYGDNYQTINNLSDFYNYNNYDNRVSNTTHNQNVENWYQEFFTDQSYVDLSTNLQTEENYLSNVTNNFEGDTVFNDNTVFNNNTVHNNNVYNNESVFNEGDVTNTSTVINQGDVYNEGNTYQNVNNTYLIDAGVTVNLQSYITTAVTNVVQQIFQDGGAGKKATFKGEAQKFTVKVMEFDPETCENTEVTKTLEPAEYTPKGTIVVS